jgi:hypothetical protein
MPSRVSADYGGLVGPDGHVSAGHALRFRHIDAENQRLSTEYNTSILSPSINKKKDSLMRSLKVWPLKHSIT